MINVSVDGNNIIVKEDVNIGMATALPSGNLIVPVVKNADTKNLTQLASEVNALVAKARDNQLGGDEVKGSTFTIMLPRMGGQLKDLQKRSEELYRKH